VSPSVFLDRGAPPTRAGLETVLGKTMSLWTELQASVGATFAPLGEKWSYSGKSHGWLLQLKYGKKTVVNLVPCRNYFVASLALNEKGCEAAQWSGLSEAALDIVRQAPKYPEGRGVRLEVRSKKDLADVKKLASIRMDS
jgi:hypothetical protein